MLCNKHDITTTCTYIEQNIRPTYKLIHQVLIAQCDDDNESNILSCALWNAILTVQKRLRWKLQPAELYSIAPFEYSVCLWFNAEILISLIKRTIYSWNYAIIMKCSKLGTYSESHRTSPDWVGKPPSATQTFVWWWRWFSFNE